MIVGRMLSWRIILRYAGRPVAVHIAIALAISLGYEVLGARWLSVPALPVSLLAAALGVLLAFRNNSAYERWWEARTIWGGLVNASRTLARQVLTFLPAPRAQRSDGTPEMPSTPSRLVQMAVQPEGPALAPAWSQVGDGAVRDPLGHARDLRGPGEPRGSLATFIHPGRETPRGVITGMHEGIAEDARELVYAQMGFVNALRCHLRRQDPFPDISPFFRPSVLEALRVEQNVPSAILLWMGTRMRRIYSDVDHPEKVYLRVAMDQTLTELTNYLGACERIKNTPLPRQYDILPHAMVRVYLTLLPLGIVTDLGVLTPLVTALIAFLFIAMDAVGRDVENPFENGVSDTPMTALCRTIEINLRQMLGESALPPPLQPKDGLLH
ncbi:bestrophin family protein [Corallococcus sp. EGB]|uniref:bestrophin family protein n=1 Tax=Corallococcus sp. EGB TaxID=1521117 RepID=UPI001CC039D1|nr:bestrophin family ion channel [Corallococcus sp. EGB]